MKYSAKINDSSYLRYKTPIEVCKKPYPYTVAVIIPYTLPDTVIYCALAPQTHASMVANLSV